MLYSQCPGPGRLVPWGILLPPNPTPIGSTAPKSHWSVIWMGLLSEAGSQLALGVGGGSLS